MKSIRFRYKALLVGWFLSTAPSFAIAFLIAAFLGVQGGKASDVLPDVNALLSSNRALVVLVVLSATFYLLGGYVAARMAQGSEIAHSIAVGVLSALTGVITSWGNTFPGPQWLNYFSWLLIAIAILMGGYFGKSINGRQRS